MKKENVVVSYLPEMLSGEELKSSLEYLPFYDETVRMERIIEIEEPFYKIIPCIMIQCPFDCSVKSMHLGIL